MPLFFRLQACGVENFWSNILVLAEAEAEAFAGGHIEVLGELEHLAYADLLLLLVGWCEQVKVQGVEQGTVDDFFGFFFGKYAVDEVVVKEAELAFALHQEVVVFVDEHAGDQVAQVAGALVAEAVGQKVVDLDGPDESAALVLFEVAGLPEAVALVKLEHVGVHVEHQYVACDLDVHLKVALLDVAEFEAFVGGAHAVLDGLNRVAQVGFEDLKMLKGVVVHVLLETRLVADQVLDQGE